MKLISSKWVLFQRLIPCQSRFRASFSLIIHSLNNEWIQPVYHLRTRNLIIHLQSTSRSNQLVNQLVELKSKLSFKTISSRIKMNIFRKNKLNRTTISLKSQPNNSHNLINNSSLIRKLTRFNQQLSKFLLLNKNMIKKNLKRLITNQLKKNIWMTSLSSKSNKFSLKLFKRKQAILLKRTFSSKKIK